MTDHKKFWDVNVRRGNTQDGAAYNRLHVRVGEEIIKKFNPESLLDIGCGSGAMIEFLLNNAVNASGIDNNKYAYDYYCNRNPDLIEHYLFKDVVHINEGYYDVVSAIESFEHFDDYAIDVIMTSLQCKYFVFSSTSAKAEDDIEWGHINVKTQSEWIKLFSKFDYELIEQWTIPTNWTKVFKCHSL